MICIISYNFRKTRINYKYKYTNLKFKYFMNKRKVKITFLINIKNIKKQFILKL